MGYRGILFSHTSLSWQWAQHPYFAPGDVYWVPFQFWIVGGAYRLASPWLETSSILVLVFVNIMFLVGSLAITYLMSLHLCNRASASLSLLLGSLFAGDIFVSYSGLSEPILIFFTLLASYIFVRSIEASEEKRPRYVIGLGAIVLCAAATHLIGWFLAGFLLAYTGVLLVRSVANRRLFPSLQYAVGGVLCVIFPILWMTSNYIVWGNPLHFTQMALQMQASYAGRLPIIQRFVIPPFVFFQSLPAICAIGIASVAMTLRQDRRSIAYIAPTGFVFLSLWACTVMAFIAPYQEPRYMVVFGWVLIPFIAAAASRIWQWRTAWSRAVVAIAVATIVVTNVIEVFSFSNSFGPDVREVAERAGMWLRAQDSDAQVLIQADSFAERGVIPVVAGYPDRFRCVEQVDWSGQTGEWLAIAKDSQVADHAQANDLYIEQVGAYFLISTKPLPTE